MPRRKVIGRAAEALLRVEDSEYLVGLRWHISVAAEVREHVVKVTRGLVVVPSRVHSFRPLQSTARWRRVCREVFPSRRVPVEDSVPVHVRHHVARHVLKVCCGEPLPFTSSDGDRDPKGSLLIHLINVAEAPRLQDHGGTLPRVQVKVVQNLWLYGVAWWRGEEGGRIVQLRL